MSNEKKDEIEKKESVKEMPKNEEVSSTDKKEKNEKGNDHGSCCGGCH